MTPEQITQLLNLLEKIANRPFTITQATDWQMLYALLGMITSSLMIAVGLFWRDVSAKFKDVKDSLKEFKVQDCKEHEDLKVDFEKEINLLHRIIKDCQGDCCPPRHRGDNDR